MNTEKTNVGAGESSPAPDGSALRIDDFAKAIIEGCGGLNNYERHELVVWPYSDRIAAAVWTMRCLANPACEDSDVALAAILARRKAMKQNAGGHDASERRAADDSAGGVTMDTKKSAGEPSSPMDGSAADQDAALRSA